MDIDINAALSSFKEKSYSEQRTIDSIRQTGPYAPERTRNRSSSTGNKELLVDEPSKEVSQMQERWIRLYQTWFSLDLMSLGVVGIHHNESKFKQFSDHLSYYLDCDENVVTYLKCINNRLLQRHQNLEFGADKDFADSDDSFETHANR